MAYIWCFIFYNFISVEFWSADKGVLMQEMVGLGISEHKEVKVHEDSYEQVLSLITRVLLLLGPLSIQGIDPDIYLHSCL